MYESFFFFYQINCFIVYHLLFIKWEDTMKSITQVYLQQIRLKIQIITNSIKQLHAYYNQWKMSIPSITIYK